MSANGHFFVPEIETFWSGAPLETNFIGNEYHFGNSEKDTEKN